MFSAHTLRFLRALDRHNDREWFRAHKDEYEQHVRGPMIALVERLHEDFPRFAPELVADPKRCLFRPYRDTRFTDDKRPIKTNIAAHFPDRGFDRHGGAGLYLEVTPKWCWIGGGLYMPTSQDLTAIREHLATSYRQLEAIVESPGFTRAVGTLEGEQLKRMPRGYAADHPAGDYLRFRQFLAGREFPSGFCTERRFYTDVVKIFEQVAKLVRFLNGPLRGRQQAILL